MPQKDAGIEALLDITIAYELIYPQVINIFSADDTYYATGKITVLKCSLPVMLTIVLEDENAVGFMDTTLDAIDGVGSEYIHCRPILTADTVVLYLFSLWTKGGQQHK